MSHKQCCSPSTVFETWPVPVPVPVPYFIGVFLMSSRALIASVIALTSAGYATAGVSSIFYTVDAAAWATYSTSRGASISTENFNTVSSGFYGTGIAGSTAGISWTANASGGVDASAGLVTTANASNTLNFAFAPGVNGIGGNIYGTNSSFAAVPATIMVALSDGTIYFGYSNGPSDFIGFYSTGATISSLSVTAANNPSSSNPIYATADNLYFAAVPAPGAVALIGLAGLVARRRERLV